MSDMEARVSALENIAVETKAILDRILERLTNLENRMTSLETKIEVIDAKLESKPDQGWIINVMGIMLGITLASIGASAGIFALLK